MALKETLTRLSREIKGADAATRAQLKAEWIEALDNLMSKLEAFLSPYIQENIIKVSKTKKVFREDQVGHYQASELRISAGPAWVEIVPVGRCVAGATGRVDMRRQGRPRAEQTIMLLRHNLLDEEGNSVWQITIPPAQISSSVGAYVSLQSPQVLELNRPNFENALDRLLS